MFSTSLVEAVERSSVVFIAVGTPAASNGEVDLSYVEAVARGVAHSACEPKLVVEKSTVPVYTCEWIRQVSSGWQKEKHRGGFEPGIPPRRNRSNRFLVPGPYHRWG